MGILIITDEIKKEENKVDVKSVKSFAGRDEKRLEN